MQFGKRRIIFFTAAAFFDTLFPLKIKEGKGGLFRSSEKLTDRTKC
jgi:hypothetical protein